MKASERLALIGKISLELQQRYSYTEIDTYLAAFNINSPTNVSVNSKRIYSQEALKSVSNSVLLQIADDLGLSGPGQTFASTPLPQNWKDTYDFKIFISHISKDKQKATRLKETLEPYAISGFVAHEDIHPTLEWQVEIERALSHMDAFVSVHTTGFSLSTWTQQEVGYAVARGAKIISLRMGEDPTGFISRHQALSRQQKSAEEIARDIDGILMADARTSAKLEAAKKAKTAEDEIPF